MKYTSEENILQLIALMKAHGVRKVIASPGNTNISFVGYIQNNPYFQVYSCVDERAAAYMAVDMAEESGEPVALSCTGATAARNYPSALTEAFYRKLPILAIMASQPFGREGQLFPQYTDRRNQFNDIVTMSVQITYPYSDEERWSNNVKINNTLLQLRKNGGGFGIDGAISTCLGASLANPEKLFFLVLGDLATFYDLNTLGNRHVGKNLRILVSNNGTGYEMHCAGSIGKKFGEDADKFMAARGHFGKQSRTLLKHFAEDLGFEYMSAESKEEYLKHVDHFVTPKMLDKLILFEAFIKEADDDFSYDATKNIATSVSGSAKQLARNVLGEKGYQGLKKILRGGVTPNCYSACSVLQSTECLAA